MLEEEAVAEIRDCAMYNRLMHGISNRRASTWTSEKFRAQNDLCLAHIQATRYLPKDDLDKVGFVGIASAQSTGHARRPCTCTLGCLSPTDLQSFLRNSAGGDYCGAIVQDSDDEVFEMEM